MQSSTPFRARKLAVAIALVLLFLLVTLGAWLVTTPLHQDLLLKISAPPGTAVYVGSQLVGKGTVEIPLTGNEDFCHPLEKFDIETVRGILPGEVLSMKSQGMVRSQADDYVVNGRNYLCVLRRPGGALDNVLVITVEAGSEKQAFAMMVRARMGPYCNVEKGTSSVTTFPNRPWRALLQRKEPRVILGARLILTQGDKLLEEHNASQWWIQQFPESTLSLAR